MSMGPIIAGSAAGSPLSQKQSDKTQSAQNASETARQKQSTLQAEKAAGLGEMDADQPTSDRDADGRRIWEVGEDPKQHDAEDAKDGHPRNPHSLDATGEKGNAFDADG